MKNTRVYSAGLTIYEDSIYTNIIGEFLLNDFLKENQIWSLVVRKEYAEVQEINMVSYRSMHTTTKVDKKWLPVTARVIPGVALPLLVGMNLRDGHAEDPDMQKKVNNLKTPKIFFFRDSKPPTSNIHLHQHFKSRYRVHTPTVSSRYQLRDTRYISNTKQPRLTLHMVG